MNYSRYGNPVGFQRILLPFLPISNFAVSHTAIEAANPCRLLVDGGDVRSSPPRFFCSSRNEASRRARREGVGPSSRGSLLRRAGWPRRVAKRGSATTVEGWWKEAFLSLSLPPLRISRFIHPSWRWSCGGIEERNCSAEVRRGGTGEGGCREWSRGGGGGQPQARVAGATREA